MFIEKLTVGDMGSNCYITADKETKDAVIIDPGGSVDDILDCIHKNDLEVKYIVNTHGHIDHIKGNEEIIDRTCAELLIHQKDARFLEDGKLNLSESLVRRSIVSPTADKLLKDDSKIKFGNFSLKVIHTPGHTEGSISLLGENNLFSGDTLFFRGVGRTDFPTGSRGELDKSLAKLSKLDSKIKVYPGHGPSGNLEDVKENNPYI